ncbi:MAG: putative metal-dependent hydrolase [Bacteroidia bacterium]|nr:putative metal-dependent hydrolase [Bacteroidia bacterium]NNC84507.1 putative metal-dependent hydrolase [Bacteroidia bacterium]NNM15148.1 putative metal-dependent hydrolase [Bacteroidia bacterium]
MEINALKFPIGKLKIPIEFSSEIISEYIHTIEKFPSELKSLSQSLSAKQLNWRYRPDGWKVKQVVHHCGDSHVNAYIRYKWTLTEDTPTIKAYNEASWAELPDSRDDDLSTTLQFIHAVHGKWVNLLKTMEEDDFKKVFIHHEHGRKVSLALNTAIYDWHCKHHLAHIKQALESKGAYN